MGPTQALVRTGQLLAGTDHSVAVRPNAEWCNQVVDRRELTSASV